MWILEAEAYRPDASGPRRDATLFMGFYTVASYKGSDAGGSGNTHTVRRGNEVVEEPWRSK